MSQTSTAPKRVSGLGPSLPIHAEKGGSFKVIFVVVLLQVQVAAYTGEVKEVSLRQAQLTGVGLG